MGVVSSITNTAGKVKSVTDIAGFIPGIGSSKVVRKAGGAAGGVLQAVDTASATKRGFKQNPAMNPYKLQMAQMETAACEKYVGALMMEKQAKERR